jgi:hypothetical protein
LAGDRSFRRGRVTSYLLVLFVPLLDWHSWMERLSVFGAFGHPYLELPRWAASLLGHPWLPRRRCGGVIATRLPKTA